MTPIYLVTMVSKCDFELKVKSQVCETMDEAKKKMREMFDKETEYQGIDDKLNEDCADFVEEDEKISVDIDCSPYIYVECEISVIGFNEVVTLYHNSI